MRQRDSEGKFARSRKPFSLENFDDGYVDATGRFRVYCPNHPRASNMGYVLRSIAAYEAYHGIRVPNTMAIHHVDGDQLNDKEENLLMLLFGQHTAMHLTKKRIKRQCKHCGEDFYIKQSRLDSGPTRGTFCSLKCFYAHPKSDATKKRMSEGRLRWLKSREGS